MSTECVQPSIDDLGTSLSAVTFCVVDLETTGGGPNAEITEIGAVLVRGGEILGEFQTLVRPHHRIPPMIQVMTGITTAMVADAPRLGSVLGSFLEFSTGAVIVAHNARFDVGFLDRACAAHGVAWHPPAIVDTVALARQALLRDEVPNCKLTTLARHFSAATQPNHRALSDARATVDVMHGLLERMGSLGVSTLEDLSEFTHRISPDRRAKRVWASALPSAPGVYWFTCGAEVLYVGKSRNLRRRVRSYFTASETRGRIHEMVRVANGVQHVECASELEASVRELRLIASHSPRYNRRSRRQDNAVWVRLTDEAFPRLSVVRTVGDKDVFWGPFASRRAAGQAIRTMYDAFRLRRCTTRLSAKKASPACALTEFGACPAPCESLDVAGYGEIVAAIGRMWSDDMRPVLWRTSALLRKLVAQERFEEADELAERIRVCTRTAQRWHRITSLARCPQLVAAAREGDGWVVHIIRYGRLAGAARTQRGSDPLRVAEEAVEKAETVLPSANHTPAATVEEAEVIAAWLESGGVRLIEVEGEWSWPLNAVVADEDLARHLLGTGPRRAV